MLPIEWPLITNISREYQASDTTELFEEYVERLYGLRIEYDEHGKNIIILTDPQKYTFAVLKFGG